MMKTIKAWVAAAAVAITAVGLAGAASASPNPKNEQVFCKLIAADPTEDGVTNAVLLWMSQAGTSNEAIQEGADTLTAAVNDYCPQYKDLVLTWARHRAGGSGIQHGTVVERRVAV